MVRARSNRQVGMQTAVRGVVGLHDPPPASPDTSRVAHARSRRQGWSLANSAAITLPDSRNGPRLDEAGVHIGAVEHRNTRNIQEWQSLVQDSAKVLLIADHRQSSSLESAGLNPRRVPVERGTVKADESSPPGRGHVPTERCAVSSAVQQRVIVSLSGPDVDPRVLRAALTLARAFDAVLYWPYVPVGMVAVVALSHAHVINSFLASPLDRGCHIPAVQRTGVGSPSWSRELPNVGKLGSRFERPASAGRECPRQTAYGMWRGSTQIKNSVTLALCSAAILRPARSFAITRPNSVEVARVRTPPAKTFPLKA
jgi:hypothetical protein